ncbi:MULTISPECIES: dihydroorotase [unclassified Coleofasciculus]|uniref:dihydroorotase n=1 Tax=unclassified Coleofasciculus TaxID=2692782 RepID=UPI001881F71B|nr:MULTISPECIES: dihydroorotase [unclassified Coleofasciculus]MBE9127891.1 dihydroorotase [Coleofasciculus sp. LEGE 07081]MBE9148056.1 dihydroorotase [Coleofasciculus sp. LEGE 07092]
MTSELLQQVRVVDPVSRTDQLADVLIADGFIKAIDTHLSDLSADTVVRDCRGLILAPGLVDLYSHSGEPGFEERETWFSLLAAAAAGGFTRVAILPDTMPPLDNLSGLARVRQQPFNSQDISPPLPHLYYWGAFTMGVEGQQMTEVAELAAAGVVGFADGRPLSNLLLLRRLLEYLQPLGKPIALVPCDSKLKGNGVMREGANSIRFGLPGNPAIAESAAVAAILEVVAAIGTPVHLMRISTRRGVELIQDAKARGLPITASTSWMHLLLNTDDLSRYDPNLRLEPPLGNPDDQGALLHAAKTGILDAIAIDHSPYTYEEKTVAFTEAPPGAIGLELALPLLWHSLVETGEWSALELWQSISTTPTICLGQEPAAIAPNRPTELVLFNPEQTWTADKNTLKSLSSNTPWLNQQIVGRVVQTWCPAKG